MIEFIRLLASIIVGFYNLIKLFFLVKENPKKVGEILNNPFVDKFLVVGIGIVSLGFTLMLLKIIGHSSRPYVFWQYGGAIMLAMVAGFVFFITSSNLVLATVVPVNKNTNG